MGEAAPGDVSSAPVAAVRSEGAAHEWRHLLESARPLPLFFAIAYVVHRGDSLPDRVLSETNRERAVGAALESMGLAAKVEDIHFVSPTQPWVRSPVVRERAIVVARRRGEPRDIYLVDTRRSPDGHLIDVAGLYNLTSTSAADEQGLVVQGDDAAWMIAQEGAISSVQYATMRGEPVPNGPGWSKRSRLQNALTNYQETGQTSGIGRRSFKLDPPAYKVVLGFSKGALLVDADAHKIRIPLGGGPIEGARYVHDQTPAKARPGNLVTWAVDRVRALPWIGDTKLQLLKAVAFQGVDQFEQIVGTVTGDDGAESVAEELGDLYAAPSSDGTNAETGWPPPPLVPMLDPPLKGEGKWVALNNDPFVLRNVGAPAPFVYTFIRADKKRRYSQVFITLWDPRQVELNMVSGTVEPKSATGETGTGMVPRNDRTFGRFVAAFNGGFQAIHGEFGMMADRVLYLPPKPYGATVAKLSDGATGFGTWPEDSRVPEAIVSFRQNMTPLIVDEVPNPYKRHWWGGVPPGWTEESRTVRSALCMTKEGFVGYFYGANLDPDVLALSMKKARCTYGVHLDMNAGHTGLEFYRVGPKGSLPNLGRRLDDVWEAAGPVPGKPGWEFMSRRMIRFMALMNFPRYINTEGRDFFYLTLRHVLPGDPAPTAIPGEGEGAWRTQGLPQHGWPYAVATTNVRPEASRPFARVGLIKIDPRVVRVAKPGDVAGQRILDFRSVVAEGPAALWHSETTGFVIGNKPPDSRAEKVTSGFPEGSEESARGQAAIGIDAGGMLIYARVTEGPEPGRDAALLGALLHRMHCDSVLMLPRPLGADFARPDDPQVPASTDRVTLVRGEGNGVRRIFPSTPIVMPKRWAPLQQKSVKLDATDSVPPTVAPESGATEANEPGGPGNQDPGGDADKPGE
ncbi:MAG TPA: hypothetical protein VFQ61_28795 [Polyangiaceae bacterium]|nr:hypothetical protein [Polyangiaceae bacterium]